jgi:Zn-dependent M28 family amino/carboxypeptidase
MSKRISFYLNFAVVGEEQGLYGAKHLADVAKDGKWNIAMLNNDMIGNSLSSGTMLRDNTKVRVLVKPSLI